MPETSLFRPNADIEVKAIPGKGRGLVASKGFPKGSWLFSVKPYGVCIYDRERWCAACLRFSKEDKLPFACASHESVSRACCDSVRYCSEACRDWDEVEHDRQCAMRGAILKAPDRKLTPEQKGAALLLVDIWSRRQRERAADSCSSPSDESRARADSASYADLLNQVQEFADAKGFDNREEERRKVCRFVQGVIGAHRKPGQPKVKFDELCGILRTEPSNAFNMRDADGCARGWIFYPQAALMNHSCAPNCGFLPRGRSYDFYALQDIGVGDELTQCYVKRTDTSTPANCQAWGFTCSCELCRKDPDFVDTTVRCQCGAVSPFQEPNGPCHCFDRNLLPDSFFERRVSAL